MKKYLLGLLICNMLVSCSNREADDLVHTPEDHGHEHGSEWAIDTTIWKHGLELFVEFPPLIVGELSRFTTHITRLDGHLPVKDGEVIVSLIRGDKGIRHKADQVISPGIFMPALQPVEPGEQQLLIEFINGDERSLFDLGMIQVYPSADSAKASLSDMDSEFSGISFLKEQAWESEIQTTQVKLDSVYGVLHGAGRWIPAPGNQRTLSAGSEGHLEYASKGLVEGMPIRKGQLLFRVSGSAVNKGGIDAEIAKARTSFEQTKMALDRKRELYDLKLVTVSEFQQASADFKRAETEYQQLLTNYTGQGVEVRSPVSGYVKKVEVLNGDFVQAGQPLIVVNSDVRGMIRLPVAIEQVDQVGQTREIWIRVEDAFRKVRGKVASVSRSVSPEEPMISVFLEVDPPVIVVEGALAEVQLIYGVGEKGILVPRRALLEEFGQHSVIVQKGGEEFERRKVRIGPVNGDVVAITDGLLPGEWVVSKGAYQVSMAALTGAVPDHGHVH